VNGEAVNFINAQRVNVDPSVGTVAVRVAGLTVSLPSVMNPAAALVKSLSSLAFDAGGAIDVTNNQIVATANPAAVQVLIKGGQLFTSSTGGTLGYSDNGGGQTKVRFTLGGDTDLDAAVAVNDLGALATNYGMNIGAVWSQGDFDYNGTVDVGDLGALATNYGLSLGGGSVAAPPALAAGTGSISGSSPNHVIPTAQIDGNAAIAATTPFTKVAWNERIRDRLKAIGLD
jgi:hypothetical protein